jgi:hypothetical protein
MSGPLVPGIGFGVAKDANRFIDLLFEFVSVDEAIDLHGAKERRRCLRATLGIRGAVRLMVKSVG